MSCEVFCCEIPEILKSLVEDADGLLLKKLFSILDSSEPLDNYLAGYFEKVLEMLLRLVTADIIRFLNSGGIELFQRFTYHIGNYSVMQIIQRLMLPHIPFSVGNTEIDKSAEESLFLQCNWSYLEESCDLLCSKMLSSENDTPSHISDLLITVLQLSPPDSKFLSNLCQVGRLEKLIIFAFSDNRDENDKCIAALSVLESLTARLCESLSAHDYIESRTLNQDSSITALRDSVKNSVSNLVIALKKHLSNMSPQLSVYATSEPEGKYFSQTKSEFVRLGIKGLQLVKFLESIVRLGDPELDEILCLSSIISHSLDMFFHFELNSLLHLSVQRIICMILEGGSHRR